MGRRGRIEVGGRVNLGGTVYIVELVVLRTDVNFGASSLHRTWHHTALVPRTRRRLLVLLVR